MHCRSQEYIMNPPSSLCTLVEIGEVFLLLSMSTYTVVVLSYHQSLTPQIEALLKRFEDMRAICPTIQDLAWKSAVDVLCVNGMDVDKACYAVQCDWLQPLYDSINSEHKKLKQDEMKEIKEIISKKDELFSKEVQMYTCMKNKTVCIQIIVVIILCSCQTS